MRIQPGKIWIYLSAVSQFSLRESGGYMLLVCINHISISYSLSSISRAFPSSISLERSLSLSCRSVFETTPMRMSIDLMSFFTVVIAFLMFCSGFVSEKLLPVSSILLVNFSSRSFTSYNSFSSSSVFLLIVVYEVWISVSCSECAR